MSSDETLAQILAEISLASGQGNGGRALGLTEWLFRSEKVVPDWVCVQLVSSFGAVVRDLPKPTLAGVANEYTATIGHVIARALRADGMALGWRAETIVYRWYESRGEYHEARVVIARIRERFKRDESPAKFALLTNNFGFEYFLQGRFADAEPYFIEARDLYEVAGDSVNAANVNANILSCRFALTPSDKWEALLPDLHETHHVLAHEHDWRRRKTYRLYAERAAALGRLAVAVRCARRAVKASRAIATQLRQDDEDFLMSLERCQPRRHRTARPSQKPLAL